MRPRVSVAQPRMCSLIVDEMKIKEKLQYNKQQDCFVGQADVSGITGWRHLLSELSSLLSNHWTHGIILHSSGQLFYEGLTGPQLHNKLLIFVLEKVEACGFRVVNLM